MGIEDINEMTSSVGSNYTPGHNVNKITEHLASIRFDREAFFKGVIEAGYTKKDGSVDLKAFKVSYKLLPFLAEGISKPVVLIAGGGLITCLADCAAILLFAAVTLSTIFTFPSRWRLSPPCD